jgi:hypothetical protein
MQKELEHNGDQQRLEQNIKGFRRAGEKFGWM